MGKRCNRSASGSENSDLSRPLLRVSKVQALLDWLVQLRTQQLQTATLGYFVVVSRGETYPFTITEKLQGFEYWVYRDIIIDGIGRDANPPSATNYDWTRVYNVPAAADGTASTLTNQGTYSVYERTSNNFYQYINTFIMPDAETNRHLGFKMEITKHVDGSYSAYVLSKGNGTFTQPGRVNILSWQDASTGWKLELTKITEVSLINVAYRLNDYVKVGDKVYQPKQI